VTNTLVAIGQMANQDQLEKAFAGATVHDMFNYLTVAVLLPLELTTGYLARVTSLMVKNANTENGAEWEVCHSKFFLKPRCYISDDSNQNFLFCTY
jgi:sodium-dependent phosphate cotransporter